MKNRETAEVLTVESVIAHGRGLVSPISSQELELICTLFLILDEWDREGTGNVH